jgi:hypothetical protein
LSDPLINHDIFKDNPYEPEFAITKKAAGTGALTPAGGIVGSTIHISATYGGPTIHADVSGVALERVGKVGYYYTPFTIAVINARLFPTYDRKTVYIVWTDPVSGKVVDTVKCYSVRDAG